jgi:hypothetical protein
MLPMQVHILPRHGGKYLRLLSQGGELYNTQKQQEPNHQHLDTSSMRPQDRVESPRKQLHTKCLMLLESTAEHQESKHFLIASEPACLKSSPERVCYTPRRTKDRKQHLHPQEMRETHGNLSS